MFTRIHATPLLLPGPLALLKSGTFKLVRSSVMHAGGPMMAAFNGLQGPQGQFTPTTIKVKIILDSQYFEEEQNKSL